MNGNITHRSVLSLGSNIGDRRAYLEKAVQDIRSFATVVRCSSVYETEPVGYEEQGLFLNAVVLIKTGLSPRDLMSRLLMIEAQSGRIRSERYGPRTLDIDIIFYGRRIIREDGLSIPHPEFANRRFVLAPMTEIAPEWFCPVHGKTSADLLKICPDKKSVRRLADILFDNDADSFHHPNQSCNKATFHER